MEQTFFTTPIRPDWTSDVLLNESGGRTIKNAKATDQTPQDTSLA